MASSPALQHPFIRQLREEANEAAEQTGLALASFAWSWPFRGILFAIAHPNIIISVKRTVVRSTLTSVVAFLFLAMFTYFPQAALLSLFTGFLGPFLALILVGAESVVLLTFFARELFLEPALTLVFDTTLVVRGQTQLFQHANSKTGRRGSNGRVAALGDAFVRPFQSISRNGMMKYIASLPLNFFPVIGTVAFLLLNGHRGGPGWHARYFQLKGFNEEQTKQFVKKHQPEYTAFGMAALLLNFIPLIGLVFTFTTTIGAALWAADLEARANLIESNNLRRDSRSDQ